jgi:hypothetical protein
LNQVRLSLAAFPVAAGPVSGLVPLSDSVPSESASVLAVCQVEQYIGLELLEQLQKSELQQLQAPLPLATAYVL